VYLARGFPQLAQDEASAVSRLQGEGVTPWIVQRIDDEAVSLELSGVLRVGVDRHATGVTELYVEPGDHGVSLTEDGSGSPTAPAADEKHQIGIAAEGLTNACEETMSPRRQADATPRGAHFLQSRERDRGGFKC